MRRGEVVGGRFVVEGLARKGGMGSVYRAVDPTSGAAVAVKILTATGAAAVQRFDREAALLAEMASPSVVRHVASGVTETGRPFVAMEWLEGEDLADRLARAPMSLHDAVSLARGAARGLAIAHARGVVHRDIKPSNLFLVAGDAKRVKLLDFGVAMPSRRAPRLTAFGLTVGTVGYMAPEQACGDGEIDARADVFALGCVLFECLSGRRAFEGRSDVETLAQVFVSEPPSISDLCPEAPAELVAILSRMLAKQPADRFADAGAVLEALDAVDLPSRAAPRRLELVFDPEDEPEADVALASPLSPPPAPPSRRGTSGGADLFGAPWTERPAALGSGEWPALVLRRAGRGLARAEALAR
jgi:eukaryotic-like serine/threonine-protein kinase